MDLDFKELLARHQINPRDVLVLRHTPKEPDLRRVFHWLAAEHPAVFNAYQQTQNAHVEKEMKDATYIASFLGDAPRSALFVGLYQRHGQKLRSPHQIRSEPTVRVLEKYGCRPETRPRLWFDLRLLEDFFGDWKGKLKIQWPGKEINYHRRADRADFRITAIHEDSRLSREPPVSYEEWDLKWDDLKLLPESWRAKLREWRGVYFIFDTSDGRGYVGSASGAQNLLGRWLNYANRGDGGNQKLRTRNPRNFRFSILEVVGPETDRERVIQREEGWKLRLRTRTRTHGLNLPELEY